MPLIKQLTEAAIKAELGVIVIFGNLGKAVEVVVLILHHHGAKRGESGKEKDGYGRCVS